MSDIDDIDRQVIELLRADGRMPTKAIARTVGLAETTVAARLRQLREERGDTEQDPPCSPA